MPISRHLVLAAAAVAAWAVPGSSHAAEAPTASRPNILLIIVDDMNYDTPGFTGNPTPQITPNIDRLASQSLWFVNGHVAAAICQPSRQAMMTGCYPHNNSAGGFDPIAANVPTLQEQLRAAGYVNGILGKVPHLKPEPRFCWDYAKQQQELGEGRDPQLYHRDAAEFLAKAKELKKPFFLMANSHDPHRPFAGSDEEKNNLAKGRLKAGYPSPSRVYKAGEVPVPGFLPDLPEVRRELAEYASSCHRADETVGQILAALKESGQEDNTLVMFLSDNGMSFPFAKTNCYLTSTRTPWLVRWPGHTTAGVDREHFICGIDFMPTILEAAGLPAMGGMDGRSFLPLLEGKEQGGRKNVFTTINTTAAHLSFPMRCLQDRQWGYIYNSWSDGQKVFKNESQDGRTWKAMKDAAASDPQVAARAHMFEYRVPEELYDLQRDPSCLTNLAKMPEYQDQLRQMRRGMKETMEKVHDPVLKDFSRQVPAN